MTVRRATVLAALSTAWVIACLAVPPMLADWLSPSGPPIVVPPRFRQVQPAPPVVSDPASQWRSRIPRPEDVSGQLDVYGNEITRPVATYRVDARGTLYEVHSPHTEVPRLPAPKL